MPTKPAADRDVLLVRVNRLDRDHDALISRVDEIAKAVVELSAAVEALAAQAKERAKPTPSWYDLADPAAALALLAGLEKWLNRVYVRWPDGILPDCWRRHDWIVEELLVLSQAHKAAWAPGAPATAREEWLRRYRSGTVQLIADQAGVCNLAKHRREHLADFQPCRLEGIDDARSVAEWWVATAGQSADPAPTEAAVQESTARRQAALQRNN